MFAHAKGQGKIFALISTLTSSGGCGGGGRGSPHDEWRGGHRAHQLTLPGDERLQHHDGLLGAEKRFGTVGRLPEDLAELRRAVVNHRRRHRQQGFVGDGGRAGG